MAGIGTLCGRKLFRSGNYSDLTLACESKDFHVHKAIVCTASPLLGERCERYSEVCSFVTHLSDVPCAKLIRMNPNTKIQALDDDPATVQMMLEHLYTRQYDVGTPRNIPVPTSKDIAKSPLPVDQLDAPSEATNDDAAHGPSGNVSDLVDHMKGSDSARLEETTKQSSHALSQHMELYKLAHDLFITKIKDAAADNIIHESESLALTSKRFPSQMRQMLHDSPFSKDLNLRARLLTTCLDQIGLIKYAHPAEACDPELIVLLRQVEPIALQYAERWAMPGSKARWDARARKAYGTA